MNVPNLNEEAIRYMRDIHSFWKMRAYFVKNLPSAWWWGLRVRQVDGRRCEVTIPYCWRTKNPFRSIYFAALAGAGELSTGVLANVARAGKASTSMLVTEQRMEFVKKAATRITFVCEDGDKVIKAVNEAVETGEPRKVNMTSIGRNTSGEIVAKFEIEWSFKKRTKRKK